MNWLSRIKKNTVIGIDIGGHAIKFIELSKLEKDYRIESYAVVPLPKDSVIGDKFIDMDNIVNAIKEAITQSGTRVKLACVAVSRSTVISKTIPVPKYLSEKEIYDYVLVEAEQQIPYPIDKINYDFEIQHETADDNAETVDVLFVASRQENIDNRVEVLQKAGLVAKSVNVESFVIENVLSLLATQSPTNSNNETIAVVDMGADVLTLNVFHKCQIIYTREQNFGGKALTSQIQDLCDLSYEEAELAKKQGNLPNDHVSILNSYTTNTVQKITRMLHFFNHSGSADKKVDSVMLIGGSLMTTGLAKLVEQALEIPTFSSYSLDKHTSNDADADTGTVANRSSATATSPLYPLPHMILSDQVDPQSLSKDASLMVIACGLALSGLVK